MTTQLTFLLMVNKRTFFSVNVFSTRMPLLIVINPCSMHKQKGMKKEHWSIHHSSFTGSYLKDWLLSHLLNGTTLTIKPSAHSGSKFLLLY
jgi:hypothetical protein